MKEKSEQQKMDALYGIRFIAALAVVCFHYNGFTGTGHDDVELPFYSILKYFYRGGWISVELFFIISGYTHYFFYLKKIKNGIISGKLFGTKKFARLFPLYWFSTIMIVIFKFYSLHSIGEIMITEATNNFSRGYILLNILGIARGWVENISYPYNGAAWSMSVDIFLYILFFFLAKFVRREEIHKILILALIFCGIYIMEAGMQYPILNKEMGRGMLCFFLGALFYNLEGDIKEKKYRYIKIAAICIILLFAFFPAIRREYYWKVILLFPSIILFSKYSAIFNNILRNRVFITGGKISFSIYLNQKPLMVFLYVLSKKLDELNFYKEIFWCFYIILLLGMSAFTYKLVEQKGKNLVAKHMMKLGIQI